MHLITVRRTLRYVSINFTFCTYGDQTEKLLRIKNLTSTLCVVPNSSTKVLACFFCRKCLKYLGTLTWSTIRLDKPICRGTYRMMDKVHFWLSTQNFNGQMRVCLLFTGCKLSFRKYNSPHLIALFISFQTRCITFLQLSYKPKYCNSCKLYHLLFQKQKFLNDKKIYTVFNMYVFCLLQRPYNFAYLKNP